MTSRTNEEIVVRAHQEKEFDIFATFFDLVECLPFDEAKQFLKEDAWEEQSKKWEVIPRDRESVVERMKKYMEFALDKMENHRGLSASRSIMHFRHWLWLAGDDKLLEEVVHEDGPYAPYGGPMLRAICEKYGFPMPDGEAAVRMLNGKPCHDDCNEGCRSGG